MGRIRGLTTMTSIPWVFLGFLGACVSGSSCEHFLLLPCRVGWTRNYPTEEETFYISTRSVSRRTDLSCSLCNETHLSKEGGGQDFHHYYCPIRKHNTTKQL